MTSRSRNYFFHLNYKVSIDGKSPVEILLLYLHVYRKIEFNRLTVNYIHAHAAYKLYLA